MPPLKHSHIFYGGDYNPEQWPEEVWHDDVRLMRDSGVNLVSIGIFSWARLEPKSGEYTFDWLDRIFDLLHQNGIAVDLATASASPPAWMARHYPESLPQDENGVRYHPGGRQHYCANSTAYRTAAAALTHRLAERYASHPALAMWHINNEYSCHIPACYCDVCAAAFRLWLEKRYGTLDALNESWGTAFWSQWYYDWGEILPPRKAPTYANPGQQLDYKRFYSDSVLGLYLSEHKILRDLTPALPITTNFMGFFRPLDYNQWAPHLDFTCWDSYPDPLEKELAAPGNASQHDLTRSLKQGAPFLLMEQVTSQVNWRQVNALKRPGVMRAFSYQAVARGADGVLFFQWRAARAGAEKFHGGMVPHIGEKSRVYEEVRELGRELKKLDPVVGSRVRAEVALVIDWPSCWAVELDSKPGRIDYMGRLNDFHKALYHANIPIDFVGVKDDWSAYKLVIAPHLYQVGPETAEVIRAYVAGGGHFATNYFSGVVDTREHIQLGGYPALIRDVLGIRVEEWDPHGPGLVNGVRWKGGKKISRALDWSEIISAEGAEVLATFTEEFYKGKPAVTRNRFKKGVAHYLGTRLDEASLAAWLGSLCQGLQIVPVMTTPAGVEATVRQKGADRFLFLINHTAKTHPIDLKQWQGTDLLSGKGVKGRIKLEPRGVRIVRSQAKTKTAKAAKAVKVVKKKG